MVEREKVVVILLIVTIILSIFSVVVTFSIPTAKGDQGTQINKVPGNPDDSVGKASFVVLPKPSGGAG